MVLPQLYQPPNAEGCCVPPYDEPPEPWCGFGMIEILMDFLTDHIPCYKEEEKCVTNTENNLESRENTSPDHIDDVERFVHTILDSDDQEDIECKLEHNTALAINTEMHKVHDELENLSKLDKDKIGENETTIRS